MPPLAHASKSIEVWTIIARIIFAMMDGRSHRRSDGMTAALEPVPQLPSRRCGMGVAAGDLARTEEGTMRRKVTPAWRKRSRVPALTVIAGFACASTALALEEQAGEAQAIQACDQRLCQMLVQRT